MVSLRSEVSISSSVVPSVLVDDHSSLVHLREDVENRLRDVDQPFVDPFSRQRSWRLVGDPFRLYCQGLLDPYRQLGR